MFNPGANGSVLALALQPDGRVVVGGDFTMLGGGTANVPRNRIGRLNSDGSLDASFNPGANGTISTIAVQADGRILLAGEFTTIGGGLDSTARHRVARLNHDGSVDVTFNFGANATIYAMTLQPDGKIPLGGHFTGLGGATDTPPRNRIGRVNADGTLDAFDPGGDSFVGAIAVQPDGLILVGGTGLMPRNSLARLYPSGSVDPTFNPGANELITSIAVQPDGDILVVGYSPRSVVEARGRARAAISAASPGTGMSTAPSILMLTSTASRVSSTSTARAGPTTATMDTTSVFQASASRRLACRSSPRSTG